MKKIFPAAMIAVFGALLYTSCTKHVNPDSSSHYCLCGYTSVTTGNDSIIASYGYGAIFSKDKAAVQCALEQDTLSKKHPGISCNLN